MIRLVLSAFLANTLAFIALLIAILRSLTYSGIANFDYDMFSGLRALVDECFVHCIFRSGSAASTEFFCLLIEDIFMYFLKSKGTISSA